MTLKIPIILILLNHCNVNEAVERKGFIQVFWIHYHSLSMHKSILVFYKPRTDALKTSCN